MSELPTWAKDRARECYRKIWPGAPKDQVELDVPIIATALVAERERTLAEVRRVVEEERDRWHRVAADHASYKPAQLACDEILSRLDALK